MLDTSSQCNQKSFTLKKKIFFPTVFFILSVLQPVANESALSLLFPHCLTSISLTLVDFPYSLPPFSMSYLSPYLPFQCRYCSSHTHYPLSRILSPNKSPCHYIFSFPVHSIHCQSDLPKIANLILLLKTLYTGHILRTPSDLSVSLSRRPLQLALP